MNSRSSEKDSLLGCLCMPFAMVIRWSTAECARLCSLNLLRSESYDKDEVVCDGYAGRAHAKSTDLCSFNKPQGKRTCLPEYRNLIYQDRELTFIFPKVEWHMRDGRTVAGRSDVAALINLALRHAWYTCPRPSHASTVNAIHAMLCETI